MHVEEWIILLCLLGGGLFGVAAAFSRIRRLYLAMPAVVLFLMLVYEIRMDRWEKTVTAPIRLDLFVEIPVLILLLLFGTWQIVLSRKRTRDVERE
jgi:hypothetical protein